MPKLISYFFFLIIFVFVLPAVALSQPNYSAHKRCLIKTINIEDGLENNSVADILTDAFGFTWVATKTGLQRYNGYKLETVNPVIGGDTIKINYSVFFLKLKDNTFCITYKNGVLIYDPVLDKFARFITLPQSSTLDAPVKPVEETNEGLWCLQYNAGLVLYDLKGEVIKKKLSPDLVLFQMSLGLGSKCAFNDKYIFLVKNDSDIIAFNKRSETSALLAFKTNFLNIAASQSSLYVLSKDGLTGVNIENTGERNHISLQYFSDNASFYGNVIITSANTLLLTVNRHLLEADPALTNIKEITTLNDNPVISSGFIEYIYPDAFNRIWLMTNDDIKLIQNFKIPFQHYIYQNSINNFTRTIFFDEEKKLLLAGCFNGGLQLYDTLNNALWKTPLFTGSVKNIIGIGKTGNGKYIIATIGEGFYILDIASQKFSPLFISNKNESAVHTYAMNFSNSFLQQTDTGFIFSNKYSVAECFIKNNAIDTYKILFQPNDNNNLQCFLLAADKSLWVGSYNGVVYHVNDNKVLQTISIPGNYSTRCITEDIGKNIWIGTDKGLFVYNNRGKFLKTFSIASGLLNDCIYSMLPDQKINAVYAGSNLGLSFININGEIKNFTKEAGLQGNEFNTQAAVKNISGKFFFGGMNGITAFFPSEIFSQYDAPSIFIYELNVNNEKLKTDSAIWTKRSYTLAYDQNKINFSLTAVGQQNASAYSYEYKMNSYDKYWISTNNAVNISYNLSPGEYEFEARLKDDPAASIVLNIIIQPPFWRTWWFETLAALAILAVVFMSIRAAYQAVYKRKVQALLMQQQIFTERERISRDLHDNIGAYATAINANVDEILFDLKEKNNPAVQRLKESAREIIVHLRDSIWALNKENQTIEMLSDRIKNYIQKLQPFYGSIIFDVQENINENVLLPSVKALHILRIIQEAIHNAVKHSGCNNITIMITSREIIKIQVADNGSGISENHGSGEGIKNMKLRAEEISWTFAIENIYPGCVVILFGN